MSPGTALLKTPSPARMSRRKRIECTNLGHLLTPGIYLLLVEELLADVLTISRPGFGSLMKFLAINSFYVSEKKILEKSSFKEETEMDDAKMAEEIKAMEVRDEEAELEVDCDVAEETKNEEGEKKRVRKKKRQPGRAKKSNPSGEANFVAINLRRRRFAPISKIGGLKRRGNNWIKRKKSGR